MRVGGDATGLPTQLNGLIYKTDKAELGCVCLVDSFLRIWTGKNKTTNDISTCAFFSRFKQHVETECQTCKLVFSNKDFEEFSKEHEHVKAMFLTETAGVLVIADKTIIDDDKSINGGGANSNDFIVLVEKRNSFTSKSTFLRQLFEKMLIYAGRQESAIWTLTKDRTLRFLLLALCAAAAMGSAMNIDPLATLAFIGLVGTGAIAMLLIKHYVNSIVDARFSHGVLLEMLGFGTTVDLSKFLLAACDHQTHSRSRIVTACFLFFLSSLDLKTESDKQLIEGTPMSMMTPVMKSYTPNDISKSVKTIALQYMKTYDNGELLYSESSGDKFDTVFPPFDLFWHELVTGMLLRVPFYCYCMTKIKKTDDVTEVETAQKIIKKMKTYTWSVDVLARYVDSNLAAQECRDPGQDTVEKFYAAISTQGCKFSKIDKDHVLFICDSHGEVVTPGSNFKVPYNVTMVKLGACGNLTTAVNGDAINLCYLGFPVLLHDYEGGGLDIVPPGYMYPELELMGGENEINALRRCDTNQVLRAITPTPTTRLSEVLKIVSENLCETNPRLMALVVVNACQQSSDKVVVSPPYESSYAALRALPDKITVIKSSGTRTLLDVRQALIKSWLQRLQNKNLRAQAQAVLKYVYPDGEQRPQQQQGGWGGRGAAVCLGLLVCTAAAFIPR